MTSSASGLKRTASDGLETHTAPLSRVISEEADNDRSMKPSLKTGFLSKRYFNVNDVDTHLGNFLEVDKTSAKTLSRTFVENVLQKYKWYFPHRDKTGDEAPSLEKAWAFYEHYTLARYLVGEDGKALPGKPRAEPGEEKPSELYNPFTTDESNLNEWGTGVALYFASLRVVAVILLVTGFINIANIYFYASDEYSGGQHGVRFSLKGSAICTQGDWVVCTDCTKDQWESQEESDRFGIATDPITGDETTLVLQSACNGAQLAQGIVNWVSLVFLIISIWILSIYQKKRETLFDIGKQTATDYSVVVKNPPPDAYDPDQWREFFAPFAEKQVTCVTVALNNDVLLRKLLTRRVFRRNLRAQLPKNVDIDNEDEVRVAVAQINREQEMEPKGFFALVCHCFCICQILHLFNLFLSADSLVDKLVKITEEIKELQIAKYKVSEVFITFETEEGQRNCLTAFSTSKLNVWFNNIDGVAPRTVFEGRVLKVSQPEEPNTIRWLDLHVPFWKKIVQRFINLSVTLGLVAGCGYLVSKARTNIGPGFSAPLTTVFNSLIPLFVKLLMLIENHADEGSRQQSLYLKITLFRWVNTAILTQIITPFSSTVSSGAKDVLPTINALLWSELLLAPILRLLDALGNIKKHILGPRAKTQESMNLSFQGTGYNLGERYTDFTKVLFLCFFYSALFPATFFFCGVILFVQYYVDKYCLLRIWAPAPLIGTQLAVFSRRYFFSGALLTFSLVSAYAWAQFPYDNLCQPAEGDAISVNTDFTNVRFLNNTFGGVSVTSTSVVFCSQAFYTKANGLKFPAIPEVMQRQGLIWMTDSQETLCRLYGWSSLVILILFVLLVFGGSLIRYVSGLFRGTYKPDGEDQHIDFSSEEISGYVPQFKIGAFQYPLIAADISHFDLSLIDWTDPNEPSYKRHNLIFDLPFEGSPHHNVDETNPSGDGANNDSIEETADSKRKRPIFAVAKSWDAFKGEARTG